MKTINILLMNGKEIELKDDDDTELLEYSKKFKQLYDNKISILQTSYNEVFIFEPKKIEGLKITEDKNIDIVNDK